MRRWSAGAAEDAWCRARPDPRRELSEDPPTWESEAPYLERHGRLKSTEVTQLPASAYEPTCVDPVDDRPACDEMLDSPEGEA